jgi:hypothetical protein
MSLSPRFADALAFAAALHAEQAAMQVRSRELDEELREAALEHLGAIDALAALRTARHLRAELGLGRRRRPTSAGSRPCPSLLRERVELLLAR